MIKLKDHFTYKKIFKFTISTILMMCFSSIYSVVDGFFVSNFVGKTPFTAINFILPFIYILGGLGFMFGSGGSALIGKLLGENKKDKANEVFTFLIFFSTIIGILSSIFGMIIIRPLCIALKAEGALLEQSIIYGRILLITIPMMILQFLFQSIYPTAERPHLGFYITLIAGISNIVLDFFFVVIFKWGLVGSAVATGISQTFAAVYSIIYFSRKNKSLLKFTAIKCDFKAINKICSNGLSELLSNISMSVVGILYNYYLLSYAGEDGIAAYGVLLYIGWIFLAIFCGYAVGIAPVISYNFGSKNYLELKNVVKKSIIFITVIGIMMFVTSIIFAKPLSIFFVGYDKALLEMTIRGFLIYSFVFLFTGISIFASSMFTALNNGIISATISTLRTLVLQIISILILPLIFDLDGIWLSSVVSEIISFIISIILILSYKKKYHY